MAWGNSQSNVNWWINLDLLSQESANWNTKNESVIGKINSSDDVDIPFLWEGMYFEKKKDYWKYNMIFIVLILLFWALWVLCYKYDQFIVDYSNWIELTDNKIFNYYEQTKSKVYNILWKSYEAENTFEPIELWNDRGTENLRQLVESDKSYIYKKETLKKSTTNLFDTVVRNANRLDETKKHVSTYWFFSDKLSKIISDEESISSIQDSMSAIESIKFSSAISVFSKLDTFLESLYKETWIDKETLLDNMNEIKSRWEKDINLYIKNCYVNASEIDFNCNTIGDFDRYYELIQDTWFNVPFFKKLLEFINDKLEWTEIPSFSIKFKGFDPKDKKMTFDIEINTFKEDEIELAKNWILSPHSFILNSLINNLKLSRVIVSESIEVRSIKVTQNVVTFWSTEFIVNTSNNTFTVPIKKENQIEIDDFVY